MLLSKLNIPISVVVGGANLILVDVAPYYAYDNGKKTENMLGFKYTVAEDKTFEKFSVKIPSASPAITAEQLASAKQKFLVTFENAFAKPYRTQSGNYELSFTATGINIAK